MRKQQKSMLVLAVMAAFMAMVLFIPGLIGAGELEPADPPGSTMHSLEEIHNNQTVIMQKLNQLLCTQGGGDWITFYRDYDGDGYGDPNDSMDTCQQPAGYVLEGTDCDDTNELVNPGAACDIADNGIDEDCDGTDYDSSGSRFVDQCNGTVQDKITSLIWLQKANCWGKKTWYDFMAAAASLADGQCGLADGSVAGNWRLPSRDELQGIGTDPPATWDTRLPPVTWTKPGSPFIGVWSNWYWSGTGAGGETAWGVNLGSGATGTEGMSQDYIGYMLPVRIGP